MGSCLWVCVLLLYGLEKFSVWVMESLRRDREHVRRGGQLLPAGALIKDKSLSNTKSQYFKIVCFSHMFTINDICECIIIYKMS